MGMPCSVCAHLDADEINRRLARQILNLSELARVYGVSRDALRNHRERHLGGFLAAFTGNASAPNMGALHAEYQRLYLEALDELARAQAGTLVDIGKDGQERRTVSSTAIGVALRNVQKALDGVVRLAADAASENDAPSGVARGELAARIQDQLQRVVARQGVHNDALPPGPPDTPERITMHDPASQPSLIMPGDAQTESPAHRVTAHPPAGGQAVDAPASRASEIPLDAVMAPETVPGLTGKAREVVLAHAASQAPPPVEDSPPVMYVPNPSYPGNVDATSSEERATAGWPDVPITPNDLKSLPEAVRALIARHHGAHATPSPGDAD